MNLKAIILIVILLGLLVVLYLLIRHLVLYIGATFRNTKTLLKVPGAMEAYDLLEQASKSGTVTEEQIGEALAMMKKSGASDNDILAFINYCKMNIEIDESRMRRKMG